MVSFEDGESAGRDQTIRSSQDNWILQDDGSGDAMEGYVRTSLEREIESSFRLEWEVDDQREQPSSPEGAPGAALFQRTRKASPFSWTDSGFIEDGSPAFLQNGVRVHAHDAEDWETVHSDKLTSRSTPPRPRQFRVLSRVGGLGVENRFE